MQRLLRVMVLTSVALMPATAFAQASIVGTVRDASGAVLPGVTVEASSPGAHREDALGRHRAAPVSIRLRI